MTLANRLFLFAVVTLACVGFDQASKKAAEFLLKGRAPMSWLENTFRLEYAENPGAFLGLGANLPDWERWLVLTLFSGVILLLLAVFVCFRKDLRASEITGYSLIFSGGIGNMVDRVLYGSVIDFLNVGIGSLRTGIFNVADMAIMAGLFVIVYLQIVDSVSTSGVSETTSSDPQSLDLAANDSLRNSYSPHLLSQKHEISAAQQPEVDGETRQDPIGATSPDQVMGEGVQQVAGDPPTNHERSPPQTVRKIVPVKHFVRHEKQLFRPDGDCDVNVMLSGTKTS